MPGVVLENLKVSVKDGKACEKILTIEVPEHEVKREYDAFYQSVAPKAKVPGFRPGKAPRNVLEMHYGEDAKHQVLKNLLTDSLRSALTSHSLDPLIYPQVDDIHFHAHHLTYKAHIEVRPKIKLSKVKGLSAKKGKVELKEEDVDAELKRIQESLAQYKVVEDRAAQTGDFVIADYTCSSEGKQIDKRSDDWLEIREDEFLKGFSSQLVGLKPGDEKEIQITFPEKMATPELAGKPAVFQVKVKELKSKNLPPLNDDLAKEAGDYSTIAELKEKIRKDLTANKEREIEKNFETAILEELRKHNKIDLPPGLVKKRAENLFDELKQTFARQGMKEEDLESQREKMAPKLEEEAKQQIHVAFLLDELAVKESITVLEDDKKRKYQEIAARIRQPLEKVEEFYRGNEQAADSLSEQIRSEKAIQWIKDNAKQK